VNQQAKNYLMDAENFQLAPKYVMRDHDGKFTAEFGEVLITSGDDVKPFSQPLKVEARIGS
jgi:hypothetical protein